MSDTKKMKKKEKNIKKVRNVEAEEETEELNIHKYEKINKKLKASAEAPEFKKKKSIADKPVVTQQPVQVDVEKKKKKKNKNKELEAEVEPKAKAKAKNNENTGSVKVTADMIGNFDKDDTNAALEKAKGEEEAEENNDGEPQEKSSNLFKYIQDQNKIAPENLKSILNLKSLFQQ